MYSALLVAVIAVAGQGCPGGGCGPGVRSLPGAPAIYPGGHGGWGCCGMIAPHLLGGTFGPRISPGEQKVWDGYVRELDESDRDNMNYVWKKADFAGRRKLLGLLAKMRGDQAREQQDEEDRLPLSEQDQDRWQMHLKTLKGDALKKAEAEWGKADLKQRHALLRAATKGKK